MRVVLIGAGNIEFHYKTLLGLDEEKIDKYAENIATALVEANAEIVLTPDKGFCFEVAKKYKQIGGKKVIGVIPKSDKKFGIKHLKEYMDEKIEGKKLFNDFVDAGDWYALNQTLCLYGDNILLLGTSTGSLGELSLGYYMYKLFGGYKAGAKFNMKKINKQFIAGARMPLDTLVYTPLIKDKLPIEIEKYIELYGSKLVYIKNTNELKKKIIE